MKKNIFKLVIMLIGYIGFSQDTKDDRSNQTITFPNGDESIVITAGNKAKVLRLTTNNQATRFEGLELLNHEVVHQKELPGFNPGLDSLVNAHEAYSFSIETEGDQSKKSSSRTVTRGKDS